MSYGKFPCPNCKSNLVTRRLPRGALPRCKECLSKSVRGRLDRQKVKRQSGYDSHKDDNGVRYGATLSKCVYCHTEFYNTRKGAVVKHCPLCEETHNDVLKERDKVAKKRPEYRRRENFCRSLRKLRKAGLGIEWLDQQGGKCGICNTTEPGGRGSWHIDHDHCCCKAGCERCIRGILCHSCNVGLGHFKDDPVRLQAAIEWVRRGGAQPTPPSP